MSTGHHMIALGAALCLTMLSACSAAQRMARAQPASASAESYVPRVQCYDGSLAISCSLEQVQAGHCCANQSGVYRDAWGNVVAQ